MKSTIEKVWEHSGLKCVVLMFHTAGHRNGYVGIPKSRPLYGIGYSEDAECLVKTKEAAMQGPIGKRGILSVLCSHDKTSPDIVFDVHGGITYAGRAPRDVEDSDDLWWFGYDCGHAGDGHAVEFMGASGKYFQDDTDPVRSLEYCIGECESLADQLMEII